ncbi:MAG: MerR family transcriptional regulator [Liquorilactobacillus ghanensis]|uniref:MerR family transcriptional regulator n=1 Tax=Liquorilactobacillus ghanensis TaxID=399370 RepID=UPI0039E834E8
MYKIQQFSKLTGLSIPTLRYYENLGILRPARSKNNYREFTDSDLNWMMFILRLKQTGMPLENICKYSFLREQGDQTIEERIKLLDEQERLLNKEFLKLQKQLEFLKEKKETYNDMLAKRDNMVN